MAFEVFVDSAGWAAYFVESEPSHAEADRQLNRSRRRGALVVTTNYVLAEVAILLASRLRVHHARRTAITDMIRHAAWVEVVHVDPALDLDAWELLRQRPDKAWSPADAASFVVMARRGIAEALTTDRHFDQAGFTRLLT